MRAISVSDLAASTVLVRCVDDYIESFNRLAREVLRPAGKIMDWSFDKPSCSIGSSPTSDSFSMISLR